MWQDSQVKFDCSLSQMELILGENLIDKFDMIEDTKGNAGDRGRLLITNLRLMWHSISYPRVNLTIGYNCFITVTTKIINTIYGGTTHALYILTSYNNCRYEFMFCNLDTKSTRHFTSVMGVYRAYVSSKIYREIKLRVGIIYDKRLTLLPNEKIQETLPGVWNLSTEQGNLGTFIITDIRFVWYSDLNYQFNISMPYITIASIKIRSSKFGPTLVITSTESAGPYILGFRIDPKEKLLSLHQDLLVLHEASIKSPNFGVNYTFEHEASLTAEAEIVSEKLNENDDASGDEISNVFNAYFSEGGSSQSKPIYITSLGLAAEEPKHGHTLESLWELLPANK